VREELLKRKGRKDFKKNAEQNKERKL